MKALYSNVLTSLVLTASISVVGCTTSDDGPSNAKTNAEFGTTISGVTGTPTQVNPAGGSDQPQLPTFNFTLADDNADRVQFAVRELVSGTNATQYILLTRAEAGCASPDLNCTYTLGTNGETELPGGNAIWWVIAFDDNDSTSSGWSGGINFTVESNARPQLIRPISYNDTSFNPPDLVWNSIGSSVNYTVYVADSNPSVYTRDIQITYTPADVNCDAGEPECTLSSAQLSNDFFNGTGSAVLSLGLVRWFVQSSNGNWSNPGFFDVVQECNGDPLGSACNDNNLCTSGACVRDQVTDPVGTCVVADNNDPCDDNNACTVNDICQDGQCRATDQANCQVDSSSGLFAPVGTNVDPNQDYTWARVPNIDDYRVVVQNTNTNQYVLNGRDGQTVNCTTGTCSFEPGPILPGSYRWWVQTPPLVGGCCTVQNNGLGDQQTWHGPWSQVRTFTVGFERPITVSPVNDVQEADTTPTLSWNAVSGTNHTYQIFILDSAGNATQVDQTGVQVGCAAGGSCNYIVPAALPAGWTQWWIQANNSGLWSVHSSFCVSGAACNIIF